MPCNCFTYPCSCENGDYYDANGQFFPSKSKFPYNHILGDVRELQPAYMNNQIPLYLDNCDPLYSKNCVPNPNNPANWVTQPHRPIVNTNYLNVPPVIQQWDLASILGLGTSNNSNTANAPTQAGIFSTIENIVSQHPVITLGAAAGLLYMIFGGKGGTWERITTQRSGF